MPLKIVIVPLWKEKKKQILESFSKKKFFLLLTQCFAK